MTILNYGMNCIDRKLFDQSQGVYKIAPEDAIRDLGLTEYNWSFSFSCSEI